MGLNFDDLFGNSEVDIECPKCKTKISIKLNQVSSKITCPSCKVIINLQKDSSFDKSKKDVDKSFKDFEKTLKNFGK